ncbi:MAG: LL-diaminopimelate aminotransferase [Bacteroidales bacterium]|nr:LL-diaminopimelate aminotransferase [Bacteroidales bacterium]
MYKINDNFSALGHRYLFSEIATRVAAYQTAHPDADIIRMGIGDVTRPLAPAVIEAMHKAVDDCATMSGFHGYGPEHGYDFLRCAIVANDYKGLGIDPSEVFISDGAKSDTGNIGDIFSTDNIVGIPDPVYPVYMDTNIIAGRRIRMIPCTPDNGFTGEIPDERLDIIYLCYPNNPTGATISRQKLKEWVDYALENGSIILYDAAYEAFIRSEDIPHSIYEIEGAKECAIEFRSFSKTAGFTGIRCGFTVVPKKLRNLNYLWERRQSCKFNGASYVTQKGAEAVYSAAGMKQTRDTVDYYLGNARIIRETMSKLGLNPVGGDNSPYVWAETPGGMDSWDFLDMCLEKANVVLTPGSGFGSLGTGYFRVSAFGDRSRTLDAMVRMENMIVKGI